MTGTAPLPRSIPWWVRPAIVLPAVTALVVLVALFAQTPLDRRNGDPRLSTLSTAPLGARVLHDLAERLGWQVQRRMSARLDSTPNVIHAVLSPAIPLRTAEAHALLEHVRSGGGALVVIGGSMLALMDSLHVRIGGAGPALPVVPADSTCTRADDAERTSLWFGKPQMLTLRWLAPTPPGHVTLLESDERSVPGSRPESTGPTVVAFDYGKGRMVVAADPDVFRNDAMRDCRPGFDLVAVHALEFLRDGGDVPRTRIVFDEYHQGHGAHPGTIRAAMERLAGSPSGRLLVQLTAAGLLLLVALAPRTVPPADDFRVERRSPLEQVDALARAYRQVRATRTAARRLVRGLRRRVARGTLRDRTSLDDDAWLERIGATTPSVRNEIAQVRRAIAESLDQKGFTALGPALHQIESTLTPH